MKFLGSFWIVSGILPLSVMDFCQNHLEINLQYLSLLLKQFDTCHGNIIYWNSSEYIS
jgi:hypothetical protein